MVWRSSDYAGRRKADRNQTSTVRGLGRVAGGAGIPEVAAIRVSLGDVVLKWGEIGRIDVALRIALGYAVVGIGAVNGDKHGTGIGPAGG